MSEQFTAERDYEYRDWIIRRNGIGLHATEVVECLEEQSNQIRTLTARLAAAEDLLRESQRFGDGIVPTHWMDRVNTFLEGHL